MSIAVLDRYLASCPAPQTGTELFYFNYDYCNFDDFTARFPNAKFAAVGFAHAWQWHVSTQGDANIRPSPFTNKDVLFQGPPIHPNSAGFSPESAKSGVVGILFKMSAEDEDKLHCALDISYIRHCQEVKVHQAVDGTNLSLMGKVRAYMHFDPLNTADAVKNYFDGERRRKWSAGLVELSQWGVPEWYIRKIHNRTLAKVHHTEPVFFSRFNPISPPKQLPSSNQILQQQQTTTGPVFHPFPRPNKTSDLYGCTTQNCCWFCSDSPTEPIDSSTPQTSQPNQHSQPTKPSHLSRSSQPSGPSTQGSMAANTPLLTGARKRKRKPDDLGLHGIPKRRNSY